MFFGTSLLMVWPLRDMGIPILGTIIVLIVYEWQDLRVVQATVAVYLILSVATISLIASWWMHQSYLENQALITRLNALTFTDKLTGLYNRRYFDFRLANEIRRAMRDHSSVAVIMLDVDYFKYYNDNYGHQKGDQCLQHLSACFRKIICRKIDFTARYGGEEFVIVLPINNKPGAEKVADCILHGVRDLQIPHAHSPTAATVTVSLGVTCCEVKSDTTPEMVISTADAALYQAKKNGRNQFHAA